MVDIPHGTVIPMGSGFTIGDVLGRSFSILGRNIVPFLILSGIATLPYLFYFWTLSDTAPLAPGKLGAAMAFPFIIGFVLKMLVQAVLLHAAFQDMRGRPVSIGESFRVGLGRFFPIIGLVIVEGLGAGLGMILLVVPGIILLVMWFSALPSCVVEKLGPIESLRRSAALTKGHRWKVFGLMIIVGIGGGLLGAIFPLIGRALFGHIGLVIAQYLDQAVVGAFSAILAIVIYRDLRVAKEGIGTEQIAAVFD